ncbi:MAG: polyprenyl synthetase family protein, partial [Fervidicoccaceae archaeon]|nr:polyprenyl synthetase family protein [Fervidicoccaceae archaeon]
MKSKLSEFLSTVAKKVDDYIFSNIKGQPEELYEASLHIIRSGGKRVRPAILMASGLIFTNNEEDLIPFAASVELIHTFTLIHDDIMDKDEYRRGVKTVHTIWGEPIAITAGDLLFAKAFEIITNDDVRKRIDASRLAWAAHELSKATATVAEGQALDMSFEKRKWVTLNEYLRMVYMKTGALLEASAKIGGIIAGASPENVRLLGEYASKIGIAFQIR